jgi:hypothetical protein
LVRRLHADICNASTYIVPGVTVNVRLKRSLREFYLMAYEPDFKVTFKIMEARLLVRHITPSDAILYAHNKTLEAGALAMYLLTSVEVKTFTSAAGSVTVYI